MRKLILLSAAVMTLSASAAQPNDSLDARYYRLFAPVTFYHNVADKALALNSDAAGKDAVADEVDATLLNVYLNRPDLVSATETELRETGSIRDDVDQPIENQVVLVDRVEAPVIDEPEDAPDSVVVQKPKFWTYKGDGFLQFMQNYVTDNWYKGGESNYSMVGSIVLEANYDNKNKWKWDNKLEAKLGFLRSPSDSVHKFKANDPFVYSDFCSPLNLNLALGMDYKVNTLKERLTGTINISPFAINYRYVDRLELGPSFGLEPGKHSLLDFGSQLTADLEWKMNENVTWKTRFYAFTSYKRFELEWENTFELRVSKYITANLFLFPRFDDSGVRDDDHGYWQFKEYSSIGFAYKF